MSLMEYAERELNAVFEGNNSEAGILKKKAFLDLVHAFSLEGHSGGSAGIVGPTDAETVRHLLAFEPLTPLTGEDNEWITCLEDMIGRPGVEQNIRASNIFREKGIAYDIDAVIFIDKKGLSYTNWQSARKIKFPYTPVRKYTRFRRLSNLVARVNRTYVPRG